MKIDLDKLEQAAKAATPGPWRVSIDDKWPGGDGNPSVMGIYGPERIVDYGLGPERHDLRIVETDGGHYEPRWDDANFIATCSPDVVLALVQRVRELEERANIVEPVYLAAKALHQLSDVIDDGAPLMVHHPLQQRLVEALNESYGKL
jgi:hypothetical protein